MPGCSTVVTAGGATFAATAPRMIDTGMDDMCSEEGSAEATAVAAEAVTTEATRPGAAVGIRVNSAESIE